MKAIRGRRLTLKEKKILEQQGYDPKDFLRRRKTAEGCVFVHRVTGVELAIRI